MEELIKLNPENQNTPVSARELHEFLQSKQDFSTWIKAKIKKYGFVENQDYTSFHKIVERTKGGTILIEYDLTMDMAKELAMVEANDRGRQARQYFIECERIAKYQQSAQPGVTVSPENSLSYNVCVILNQIVVERGKLKLQIDAKIKDLNNLNAKLEKLDYEKSKFEEVLQVNKGALAVNNTDLEPSITNWETRFNIEYGNHLLEHIEKYIEEWLKIGVISIREFNIKYDFNFAGKNVYLSAIAEYCREKRIVFFKNKFKTINRQQCRCRIFYR